MRPRPGRVSIVCLSLISLGCSPDTSGTRSPTNPPGPGSQAIRVLMVTATAGFRHDSIATARQVLTTAGSSSGAFTITATEDLAALDGLAGYDVLFFALTSGELPLTDSQKAAILSFVSDGGGFLGVHSAADTLYEWPEYGALIGAYFRDHPWTQHATVVVEDRTHPSTSMLGDRFAIEEEFYTFRDNPRPRVTVLLRLDAASVETTGDFPLAWAHSVGRGRVYYNALGHYPSTWTNPVFQQQIAGAIRWATGR